MTRRELLDEAYAIIRGLQCRPDLDHYVAALKEIGVKVNGRMRTAAGRAFKLRMVIHLNPHLLCKGENAEEVRETILHEIAHLLAPRGAGHGATWRHVVREIGGNPERCHDMECAQLRRPQRRHLAVCMGCGQEWQITTRLRNSWRRHRTTPICRGCGGRVIT